MPTTARYQPGVLNGTLFIEYLQHTVTLLLLNHSHRDNFHTRVLYRLKRGRVTLPRVTTYRPHIFIQRCTFLTQVAVHCTFFIVLCRMVCVSGASSTSSAPLRTSWYTRSRKRVTPATCKKRSILKGRRKYQYFGRLDQPARCSNTPCTFHVTVERDTDIRKSQTPIHPNAGSYSSFTWSSLLGHQTT